LDLLDGFLRRVRALVEDDVHAVVTDFPAFLRSYLSGLSLSVAYGRNWSAMANAMDQTGANRMRPVLISEDVALQRANTLIQGLGMLLTTDRGVPELSAMARGLSETEEKFANDIMAAQTQGNPLGGQVVPPVVMFINWMNQQKSNLEAAAQVKVLVDSEIKPRRMPLYLLFNRGLKPVTDCALDLLQVAPTPERLPKTLRDAVLEPSWRPLEVCHAATVHPVPEFASYLTRIRRMGAPTLINGGDAIVAEQVRHWLQPATENPPILTALLQAPVGELTPVGEQTWSLLLGVGLWRGDTTLLSQLQLLEFRKEIAELPHSFDQALAFPDLVARLSQRLSTRSPQLAQLFRFGARLGALVAVGAEQALPPGMLQKAAEEGKAANLVPAQIDALIGAIAAAPVGGHEPIVAGFINNSLQFSV
jgi:hypothetical protein